MEIRFDEVTLLLFIYKCLLSCYSMIPRFTTIFSFLLIFVLFSPQAFAAEGKVYSEVHYFKSGKYHVRERHSSLVLTGDVVTVAWYANSSVTVSVLTQDIRAADTIEAGELGNLTVEIWASVSGNIPISIEIYLPTGDYPDNLESVRVQYEYNWNGKVNLELEDTSSESDDSTITFPIFVTITSLITVIIIMRKD